MMNNDFIKENISKINKNNIMIIDIGSTISDSIFINKHTYQKINSFISSISSNHSIKINKKNLVKSYFKNNVIIEMYEKKINNYSYHISNTHLYNYNTNNYKVSILDINNSPNITSNYTYDLIESSIELIIQYKNMFEIVLKQFTEQDSFYRIALKIKKPLSYDILINELTYILSLL